MTAAGTLKVSVDVKNTGACDGAEVVQLYIADPEASVDRPSKELKGFEKVWLNAGEKKTVTFEIDAEDLSWFNAEKHEWTAEPGEFKALIGSSSRDIRASVDFRLN
jgi:beta-glucosidase